MSSVQPTITPVIIKTDDSRNCYPTREVYHSHSPRHHSRDGCSHVGEFEILSSLSDTRDSVSNNARDILLNAGSNTVTTLKEISDASRDELLAGVHNKDSIINSVERVLDHVTRDSLVLLKSVDDNASKCRETTKDAQIEALRQACDLKHMVADGFGATKLKIMESECAVIRRSDDHFSQLRHELCEKVHELSKDARKDKECLSMELMHGFCAVKEKVEGRGDKTDDLIRCLEDKKLRDKLCELEKENMLLRLQCVSTSGNGNGNPH